MSAQLERNLDHLRNCTTIEDSAAREDAYGVIISMFGMTELQDLVMVLTEGNTFGPDAARALARRRR